MDFDQVVRSVLEFLGAAALVSAIFAFLGKKIIGRWIDSLFDKALERFKADQAKALQKQDHEHQEELEGIRFELSKLSHRIERIHDKEIEVLSETWKKLKNSQGAVFQLVTPFSEPPDLDRMPLDLLKETVSPLPFSEYRKRELLESKEKSKLYRELMGFKKNSDAMNSTHELNNYVLENAPFLAEDLKGTLEQVVTNLRRVVIHDKVKREAREVGARFEEDSPEWLNSLPLIREIEQMIRKRLRYSEA